MFRVLRIAARSGSVVAGKGEHAGHVERVSASTVLSLIRRGLLSHIYGSEGGLGGRLTESGLAALSKSTGSGTSPVAHATILQAVTSLGPFYATPASLKKLGFSQREIEAAVRRGELAWLPNGSLRAGNFKA